MNQPTTKIKISSDNSIDIAVGNDNYKIEYEEKVHVKRQKDSLIIIARQDSLTKTFILKPKTLLIIMQMYFHMDLDLFGIQNRRNDILIKETYILILVHKA
jgi:hypothetical protein